MEDALLKIKDFVRRAHGDQQRKFAHEPYIHHPVRVMEICREYTSHLPILAAALLHDVLEDTATTKDQIQEFLSDVMDERSAMETIQLVIALTDIYTKQQYPQWNRFKRKMKEAERLAAVSGDAQTIKYADIIDNTDIVHADTDFAGRFLSECRELLKKMPRGNPRLHERAMATVNECLEILKHKSVK
jgi:guanosine-3',5'-bis(diphosphate) 3'-pyrophosphohydrolase